MIYRNLAWGSEQRFDSVGCCDLPINQVRRQRLTINVGYDGSLLFFANSENVDTHQSIKTFLVVLG